MPTVFIPQVPSRFDASISTWVEMVNIKPAQEFGKPVVMLPPEAARLDTDRIVKLLSAAMKNYGPDDYILALGDPMVLGIACILASRASQPLRMLRWDRIGRKYMAVSVAL